MKNGLAGRIAGFFIESKLTILLIIGLFAIGIYSASLIPREEDPQINVPMVDIMVGYPGATPKQVESRVLIPLEKILSNIKGVEHIRSTAMNGQAMVIVQFYVGQDPLRSYVKLYNELKKHEDMFPKGVMPPLVKTRSIDDVPILGLTLWSNRYNDYQLRQIGEEMASEIKKVKDVSITKVIGGRHRVLKIILDKIKMSELHVDPMSVISLIQAANGKMPAGSFDSGDYQYLLSTGSFLNSAEEVANLIVGTNEQAPVYLSQLAIIEDGPEAPTEYVSFGYGNKTKDEKTFPSEYPAVTLSVSKINGSDAMHITKEVLSKIKDLKTTLIPNDVHVSVTRDYGATASEKVNELLEHLGIAIIAVTLLVILSMGWRSGLVVFLSVPLTFALTLFSYYVLGYTLNRITLFALVFVVGIVVDDSIIITENMYRHFQLQKLSFREAALFSINEVGNPTLLATFTVIAAILPMAFVSGMMGPYMSPMPIGASIAMLLSLFIALTITPYLGYHLLSIKNQGQRKGDKEIESTRIYRIYKAIELPLVENRNKRHWFLGVTILLLLGSVFLFFTKTVLVKMLPFDNKNEIQVVIDMPEGSTLERTSALTRDIAQYLKTIPEVVNYQSYVGCSAPITFNGLVRHYDLRQGSNDADIQVNLLAKEARKAQSHFIAKEIRPRVQEIGRKYGANVKIVEVPPGPPVQSTIVAEVYGPDYNQQIRVGKQMEGILNHTRDIVDVDIETESPQIKYELIPDREKAMLNGIAPNQIVGNLTYLLGETPFDQFNDPYSVDPVNMIMMLYDSEKTSLNDIGDIKIKGAKGMIPVSDLVQFKRTVQPQSIYRKDQQRVVYVLADVAGKLESPVYAILGMKEKLKQIQLPNGYTLQETYMQSPKSTDNYTVKWDGEWQITLEVFRDLGIAFGVVILLIYMLIVGFFQNFKTPLVMMLAIPLSLIGVVLGHWLLGAFFTATSFIGMIALTGVMVRNSILLIDFIEIRLKDGLPIKQAIVEAGAVRIRPILLTTGAVIIGALIILFDPIFQGLAISLVFGALVSTLLTLVVVPLIYFMMEKKRWATNKIKK